MDKTAVFEHLTSIGVTRAVVAFDGYGDEGSVGDIEYYNADQGLVIVEDETDRILTQATYAALANQGIDWYNNEGGFGEAIFDVETGEVELVVNIRYEAYNTDTYTL